MIHTAKRLTALIVAFLLVIGLIIFIVIKLISKNDKSTFKIIYDVTYVGDDGLACLTFYKDGSYSLYDCDSEPTRYFFDSENVCTYTYKNNIMTFDCKYNYGNTKDKSIEILNITDKEFKFNYKGTVKTFIARNESEV